ncbi:MAG: PLP-dependent aminotransferase family protein [Lachnospiraceae bacterium]|nr:PLP-dependent aminotransferase family protein [Lachnospiraceae bacterium]
MNELTIHLSPKSNVPMYEQLYEYIKEDIQQGRLIAGKRLPASRALSRYLDVSRSTVDLAYQQLLSEGYIEAVPRKGYYVCQIEELYHIAKTQTPPAETPKREEYSYLYDFSPSGIDLDSFPYSAWRKITKNTILDDNKEMFQLGDPKGDLELRETICSYLHQARGVNCTPEQVIVGAGNDYLQLLLSAVLGTNHRIIMENPTYQHARRIFEQLGYEVATVSMDSQGMDMEELRRSGGNIAYVMPSHQFPLGIVMSIKRRLELLAWASEAEGRYIIEDDYDSEFRYKGKPIPALQGSDVKGRVIYLGTFSKSIAPAIRISYLVLPQGLLRQCKQALSRFSSTVSRIDQTILNSFIKEGYYERHLNKMRGIYRRKHDVLLGCMKQLGSICRIEGEYAGVHILVEFTNGMTEQEAIERARSVGVKVYPLSDYYRAGAENPSLYRVLMGYAVLTEKQIEEAVERLKKVWLK